MTDMGGKGSRSKRRQRDRLRPGSDASSEPTPNMFMDTAENEFYRKLKCITKLQQDWITLCEWHEQVIKKQYKDADKAIFEHNYRRALYIQTVETILMAAGRLLGFNARFIVSVDTSETLHITPKNGSAQRMMQRWENIEAMYELGRD